MRRWSISCPRFIDNSCSFMRIVATRRARHKFAKWSAPSRSRLRASALTSLSAIRTSTASFRDSSLYFPGATSPVCPGLPNEPLRQRTRLGWIHHVLSHTEYPLSFIFGFSQNQIFQYPLLINFDRREGKQ